MELVKLLDREKDIKAQVDTYNLFQTVNSSSNVQDYIEFYIKNKTLFSNQKQTGKDQSKNKEKEKEREK